MGFCSDALGIPQMVFLACFGKAESAVHITDVRVCQNSPHFSLKSEAPNQNSEKSCLSPLPKSCLAMPLPTEQA